MSRKEDGREGVTAVPLSPGEALALRRVANGSNQPALLSSPDHLQLRKLRLVEEVGDVVRLTAIGRDILAQLSPAEAPAVKLRGK